jgi:hypothetical protein
VALALVTPLQGDAPLGDVTADALWFLIVVVALGIGDRLGRGVEARR